MILQDRQHLFEQTKQWLLEAGALIRERVNHPFFINTKSGKNDLVTEIDEEVEHFLIKKIRASYPNDDILSEEQFGDTPYGKKGIIWIIDPIDGTMNLVHQQANFAISIGVYDDGVGEIGFIYDVMNDQLYSAMREQGAFKNEHRLAQLNHHLTLEKTLLCVNPRWLRYQNNFNKDGLDKIIKSIHGIRYYGSATLQIAFVAEGKIDAYISMSLEPWDYAAGRVILNEVGGIITSVDGSPIHSMKRVSCIVCHPRIHGKIVDELNYSK